MSGRFTGGVRVYVCRSFVNSHRCFDVRRRRLNHIVVRRFGVEQVRDEVIPAAPHHVTAGAKPWPESGISTAPIVPVTFGPQLRDRVRPLRPAPPRPAPARLLFYPIEIHGESRQASARQLHAEIGGRVDGQARHKLLAYIRDGNRIRPCRFRLLASRR